MFEVPSHYYMAGEPGGGGDMSGHFKGYATRCAWPTSWTGTAPRGVCHGVLKRAVPFGAPGSRLGAGPADGGGDFQASDRR
jgi:hypothetical protein